MNRIIISCMVLLMCVSVAGCRDWNHRDNGCWQITDMTSSLQGTDNQGLRQNYDYQIKLMFMGKETVNLHAIEPILAGPIASRVISELEVEVAKVMKPGDTVEVSGRFVIDSSGLSKHDLLDMEPYFNEIRALVGEVVPLPVAVPSVTDQSAST